MKDIFLRKISPLVSSAHDNHKNSRKAVYMKISSVRSKDKAITPDVRNQVTPLYTSTILLTMDYNIVKDVNKFCTNIPMFELTKITSKWDIV